MVNLINSDNFDNEVLKSDVPVLVDFFADWCGPCRMAAPMVEKLSGDFSNIKFCKINVDESTDIASRYGVMSIPTFILFKNGEETERLIGISNELKDMLLKA